MYQFYKASESQYAFFSASLILLLAGCLQQMLPSNKRAGLMCVDYTPYL
jgi:hypothetical protein